MERIAKAMQKGTVFETWLIYQKKENGLNSNAEFETFAAKSNLKGKGNKENPFIIDNDVTLPKMFYFRKVEKYILISNLDFAVLELRECQNIEIKSCVINSLNLSKSSLIRSRGNKISHLIIASNNCKFFADEIKHVHNLISFGNVFKGVNMRAEDQEILLMDPLNFDKMVLVGLLSLIGLIFFTPMMLRDHYLTIPLLIGEIFMMVIMFFLMVAKPKKRSPNVVE